MDADGRIDVSPKGDPAGRLMRAGGAQVALAERPGNKLAFGYRNMIAEPRVAALAIVPGVARTVTFEGRARLTTDTGLREGFVVEGKAPILATVIEGVQPRLADSGALARAAPWSGDAEALAIDPAAVFVAHVKLNKARGAAAALLRLSVCRGLVANGLKTNYRTDLYEAPARP